MFPVVGFLCQIKPHTERQEKKVKKKLTVNEITLLGPMAQVLLERVGGEVALELDHGAVEDSDRKFM